MKFNVKETEKYILYTIEEDKITSIFSTRFKSEVLVLAKKNNNIICDISKVDYVDSSGLSAILIGDRLVKELGNRFIVCGSSKKVLDLFRITKLESYITLIPTLAEAKDFLLLDEIEKSLND